MKKGTRHSERTKKEISEKLKGKHCSFSTEFKKGCIPWNKGLKRKGLKYAYHNSSRTKFHKGNLPVNWKQVGTITTRVDNRGVRVRFIKIAEPNKWEYYSRYIWEQTRQREIPNGFIIYHQDGNSLNDAPNNLICIPRSLLPKFQEVDIKGFRTKGIYNAKIALKKRWQNYREQVAQIS